MLAGVVGTARAIIVLCLQLPAGALSDRFDRRLTMIICDIVRAVLLAVLGILIAVHLVSWPVVLIVSMIEGGASAIFDPVRPLHGQRRPRPRPRDSGRTRAPTGPPWGRRRRPREHEAVPFLAVAVSYAVSFGTVSRIFNLAGAVSTNFRQPLSVVVGSRLVWQVPILRAVTTGRHGQPVPGPCCSASSAGFIPSPLVAAPVAMALLLAHAAVNAALVAW